MFTLRMAVPVDDEFTGAALAVLVTVLDSGVAIDCFAATVMDSPQLPLNLQQLTSGML